MTRRRRVLCAPNAFKGTLTAEEAAIAMALGAADAGWDGRALPVADGGDGTLDVLLAAAGEAAGITHHEVTGPLGHPVRARLGWVGNSCAVVEMAEAAGLRLLDPEQRDPLGATSSGCGELIDAALSAGAAEVVVGVGGSASTDGGAGLLQALGARLLTATGAPVSRGGSGLGAIDRIDPTGIRLGMEGVRVACDVHNPLLGEHGAAAVFGPQKGATPAQVAELEAGLRHFAEVASRDVPGRADPWAVGAGAAGGAGFGLMLAGARLEPGAPLVCDVAGLTPSVIAEFDAVLTGEGRLDSQTAHGKAPAEVAIRARSAGVPVMAVAGLVDDPLPGLFRAAVPLKEYLAAGGAMDQVRAAARAALERLPTTGQ